MLPLRIFFQGYTTGVPDYFGNLFAAFPILKAEKVTGVISDVATWPKEVLRQGCSMHWPGEHGWHWPGEHGSSGRGRWRVCLAESLPSRADLWIVNLHECHWFNLIHWFERADEDGTKTIQALVFHVVHQEWEAHIFTECWVCWVTYKDFDACRAGKRTRLLSQCFVRSGKETAIYMCFCRDRYNNFRR